MRNKPNSLNTLQAAGFNYEDACALRRISMTPHRWHELECGTDRGAIEREQPFAIQRAGHTGDILSWWNGSKWVRKAQRRTYDEYERASMMQGLPTDRQWDGADFARANAQGFPSEGAWRETEEKPFWHPADGIERHYKIWCPDRERGDTDRGRIWTGLAYPQEMKRVVARGWMRPYHHTAKPRILNWYLFTEAGWAEYDRRYAGKPDYFERAA